MLLILEPFAVVLLAVGERVYTLSLAFAFDVFAFVCVTVLKCCHALAVWFPRLQLSFV